MEEWQKNHIRKRLSELVLNTDCNTIFLAKLTSGDFLSDDDQSSLDAKFFSQGRLEQNKYFYNIAVQRRGMYEAITTAIFETKQSGAFLVFLNGFIEAEINEVFQILPKIDPSNQQLHRVLEGFGKNALGCKITVQGNETAVKKLLQGFEKEAIRTFPTMLKGDLLIDLINNKKPAIIKDSVPALLEYYSRRLTSRSVVDPRLFQKSCNDVFVIRHIQPYQLRAINNAQSTDVSGNQREKITSRFIILEYEEDFDQICQLSTAPTHYINRDENGRFTCIKSYGDISTIQEHVLDAQDKLNEEEFFNACLNSTQPVCISDTPGMGKTVLLASIAHKIMTKFPLRLVHYIVLREFVPEVEKRRNDEISKDLLFQIIADQASETEFGREVVKYMLTSDKLQVELMFDGFDEVLLSQIEIAKTVLRTMAKLKSVRIYVTTRPHMREELECTLGVLGYNIQPFGLDEQIEFLTRFWEQQNVNRNKMLENFAKQCLEALQKRMNDFEKEFAGIPLQCKLLAEVYQNEALRFANPEGRVTEYNVGVQVQITSIFEMYSKLMAIRFSRLQLQEINAEQQQLFVNAHIHASLQLLFPEAVANFHEGFIEIGKLKTEDLYCIGIIERKQTNDTTPRFAHRTFAEYFLGLFIVRTLEDEENYLNSQSSYLKAFFNFLFNSVLHTTPSTVTLLSSSKLIHCEPIKSSTFQNPVVCYFINAHLKNISIKTNETAWTMNPDKLYDLLMACTRENFADLYITSLKPAAHNELVQKIQKTKLSNIHLLASKYSSLDFFKIIHQHMIDYLGSKIAYFLCNSPQIMITPLHIAVERGNYQIIEYILNGSINLDDVQYVIHAYVIDTVSNSDGVISQKSQIIRVIIDACPNLLNEALLDRTTPLLQNNVHVKLIKLLIECGADVNSINQYECVLHRLLENKISPQVYQDVLLLLIVTSPKFKKINALDTEKRTPFHLALKELELLQDTIELYHIMKADFNAVDYHGDSIIFYAIRAMRSVKLLSLLLAWGSDMKQRNTKLENVLHICAKYAHHEALEFFLNFPVILNDDVTAMNKNELTPFMQGLGFGKGLTVPIIKLMEAKGLQITPKVASDAIKVLICNKNIMAWELGDDFVQVADYLLLKGGVLLCKFGESPWELDTTKRNVQRIIQVTRCNGTLLEELKKRRIFASKTEMKKKSQTAAKPIQYSATLLATLRERNIKIDENEPVDLSNILLAELQTIEQSFERLCASLIACTQVKPFLLLKQSLQSDLQDTTMFATLPNGLLDFIEVQKAEVIVLKSWYKDLTIARLKEKVDTELQVISEVKLYTQIPKSTLTVYHTETLTSDVLQQLVELDRKIICVCRNKEFELEELKVLEDEVKWDDLSTEFQKHLGSVLTVVCKDKKLSEEITLLENKALVEIIWEYEMEFIDVENQNALEDTVYISPTIFHYFLPEKLVFQGISGGKIEEYAKFGQKVGAVDEEIRNVDYIILEQDQKFEQICNPDNLNLHLMECVEGRFKLCQSQGDDTEIRKFMEDKPLEKPEECEDFPICSCGNHGVGSGNLIWTLFHFPHRNIRCWINLLEVYPRVKDANETFKLKEFIKNACEGSNSIERWRNIHKKIPGIQLRTDSIRIQTHTLLRFTGRECTALKQVAINTLFPNQITNVNNTGLEKYIHVALLQEETNGYLTFVHENLAWYFIAEFVTIPETLQLVHEKSLKARIFQGCFQSHENKISVNWWNEMAYHSKDMQSFNYINPIFLQYLDSLINLTQRRKDEFAGHFQQEEMIQYAPKWINACINANQANLLKIIGSLNQHQTLFESEKLVVLAVMNASLPVIELIIKLNTQETNKDIRDIKLKLRQNSNKQNTEIITLLHVAAVRGDNHIMQYLLKSQGFEDLIHLPKMRKLILFCLGIPGGPKEDVGERIFMIENLLQLHPSLITEGNQLGLKPLLMPKLHFDLVLQLIELGDVYSIDKNFNTLLHLCTEYLSPQQYDALIRYLNDKGNSKLFHYQNDLQETPLHAAVANLEVLDSTLEIFSAADVNFNAVDKEGNTLLMIAVKCHRSARLLNSLIGAGANVSYRGKLNRSLLHVAAEQSNLTALKYLISRGCDVNDLDENNDTPLHLASQSSSTNTFEIIHALVQAGAKINSANVNNIKLHL